MTGQIVVVRCTNDSLGVRVADSYSTRKGSAAEPLRVNSPPLGLKYICDRRWKVNPVSILSLIYPLMEWYFYSKENRAMLLKIMIGLGIGAAVGFGLSFLSRGIGSA